MVPAVSFGLTKKLTYCLHTVFPPPEKWSAGGVSFASIVNRWTVGPNGTPSTVGGGPTLGRKPSSWLPPIVTSEPKTVSFGSRTANLTESGAAGRRYQKCTPTSGLCSCSVQFFRSVCCSPRESPRRNGTMISPDAGTIIQYACGSQPGSPSLPAAFTTIAPRGKLSGLSATADGSSTPSSQRASASSPSPGSAMLPKLILITMGFPSSRAERRQ